MKDTAESNLMAQLQSIMDGSLTPEFLEKRPARQGDFMVTVATPARPSKDRKLPESVLTAIRKGAESLKHLNGEGCFVSPVLDALDDIEQDDTLPSGISRIRKDGRK